MDHSMHHADHSGHTMPGMDHGGMDHGGHDMGGCVGSMYLNGQVENLCILTQSWRVTGIWSLLWSCLAIALVAVGFEWLRERTRQYESTGAFTLRSAPGSRQGSAGGRVRLPTSRPTSPQPFDTSSSLSQRRRLIRSVLYGLQVTVSFTLMLVFMTFNYWVMAAVVVGSAVGFYLFNDDPNGVGGKTMVCH